MTRDPSPSTVVRTRNVARGLLLAALAIVLGGLVMGLTGGDGPVPWSSGTGGVLVASLGAVLLACIRGARALSDLAFAANGAAVAGAGYGVVAHLTGQPVLPLHVALAVAAMNGAGLCLDRDRSSIRGLFADRPEARALRAALVAVVGAVCIGCATAPRAALDGSLTVPLIAALLVGAGVAILGFAHLAQRAQDRTATVAAVERMLGRIRSDTASRRSQDAQAEALAQIVAGVAHDFNNALTVVRGNLELIQADPARSDRYVREALSATDRSVTLTGELLASGQRARLDQVVAEPSDLVRGVVALYARIAPAGTTIRFEDALGAAAPRLRLDPAALERALLALVLNAQDAQPGGGRIRVRLSRGRLGNGAAQAFDGGRGIAPGDYLMLQVIDDGIGMDGRVAARAAQPYFTTKGTRGSGLGLASASGMCRQLGGGLQLRSTPGKGTTVTMALPLEARCTDRVAADLDVLVLARDADAVADAVDVLRKRGLEVGLLDTPAALEERLENHALPKAVFIDTRDLGEDAARALAAGVRGRYPGVIVKRIGRGAARPALAASARAA